VGGRVTWDPKPDGGTWDWDEEYFSATFNSPATFTALKAGTSTITYSANGVAQSVTVTIQEAALPNTGQDDTWIWVLVSPAVVCGAVSVLIGKRKRVKV
jgi:LPXTG-motif cell wall-anchored protein